MAQEASEMAGWALPKEGEFVWTEIGSNDAGKCQAFYEAVFGWQFKQSDIPGMDYREFSVGGAGSPMGGLYALTPEMFDGDPPPPPHQMIYVAVDDVDANAERAEELGGTVHKVMDVPNVGRMAIIQDPTGAMIATFQMQS